MTCVSVRVLDFTAEHTTITYIMYHTVSPVDKVITKTVVLVFINIIIN